MGKQLSVEQCFFFVCLWICTKNLILEKITELIIS